MESKFNSVHPVDNMNLVVDWGNSRLKTGWFIGSDLVEVGRYESVEDFLSDVGKRPVGHILVSSTSRPGHEIRQQLMPLSTDFWVLTSHTSVPIAKAYDTPATLGADRVAAAVGATALFPNQDCLILDLGTCLTADVVDRQATFLGGLISPGVHMRFRAMHEQTARLPMLELPPDVNSSWPHLTGKSTQQAMLSGVLNGLAFEMNGIIENHRRERPGIVVLMCGGDAPSFESRLKPPIFVVPELVLIGLNRILRYNVENLQANTPDVNA